MGMGKYCGYCGTRLDERAKICRQCGMPVSSLPSYYGQGRVYGQYRGEKSIKLGRLGKLLAISGAVIIVFAILLNTVMQFTGYNGLLRKVMTAYEDYDVDTLVSLASEIYYYVDEDWVESYIEYNIEKDLDYYEDAVGHNYKLSYEIDELYAMSQRNFVDAMERVSAYTYSDFDASTIKEIAVAELTVTVKQGKKTAYNDVNIVMSKEDGGYKLLYIE